MEEKKSHLISSFDKIKEFFTKEKNLFLEGREDFLKLKRTIRVIEAGISDRLNSSLEADNYSSPLVSPSKLNNIFFSPSKSSFKEEQSQITEKDISSFF